MNVRELIDRLGEFDPELPVWSNGGGDPYLMGEIIEVSFVEAPEGQFLLGHDKTHARKMVMLY